MWYVPFDGPPRFVKSQPHSFEENLSLSPTLCVLYNIDRGTPNLKLKSLGYILSNIPGDAIFITEGLSSHSPEDIYMNIEKEIDQILEEDEYQRKTFQRNLYYRWYRDAEIEGVNL